LSGETKLFNFALSPRAGFDLAWSPGGKGTLTAARGAIEDSESLTIPEVMGGRAFIELRLEDLLPSSEASLSVTPRLLCDWGMDGLSMGCGYGGSIELTSATNKDGASVGLGLDGALSDGASSGSIELHYAWPVGRGKVNGGIQAGTGGEATLMGNYSVDF
jgi:hypothetical protein